MSRPAEGRRLALLLMATILALLVAAVVVGMGSPTVQAIAAGLLGIAIALGNRPLGATSVEMFGFAERGFWYWTVRGAALLGGTWVAAGVVLWLLGWV